jgi:subtilase family serine protease
MSAMTAIMRRWLVALAVLTAAAVAVAATTPWQRNRQGAAAAQRTTNILGRTNPRAMIDFSLVLRLPGQPRLNRFLAELYDPASADYHHFIDANTFGRRFGLDRKALRRLTGELAKDGLHVVAGYPQRTALDVRAPAAVVERLLGVRVLDERATGDGAGNRRVHILAGNPIVPRELRDEVSGVAGVRGGAEQRADDVPAGGLTPADARIAYDINPLYSQHISGAGEKVAIVSFAGYAQDDLDRFDQHFGLPPLAPRAIPVDGGTTDHDPGDESEVELDMEIIHEIAPQAQILDYHAPSTDAAGADAFGAIIDRIVADGQARIVSDSWGSCELLTSRSDIQRDEQAIEAAVAHGISIFKASGDSGAYQCQRFDQRDHRLSAEWPTTSPGVIAVGGTALSIGAGGTYARETTWQDALEQGGGGGGLSAYFARPAWQRAPGINSRFSDGKRQLPDVSANAAIASGWATYTGGQPGQTGGTSAASPFWAASMALIDQYARRHGIARLGFVDPMLYRIAATPQPNAPFHDITVGTNRYYPATRGWDFATGLGSPDVYNLAQDVVAYLRRRG